MSAIIEAAESLRRLIPVKCPASPRWSQDEQNLWTLAQAYLAEHPADDGETVTEEWLPISAMGIAGTKRLGYIVASRDDLELEIVYLPQCGPLPPAISIGSRVVIRNPTRGDVRRLCNALRIKIT